MTFKYRGLNINYKIEGNGKPIILLHGWGTSMNTFESLTKEIKENYQVHLIDLIGFGKSDLPLKPINLNEYVLCLYEYINYNNISKPIILGHSFGGRIAIKYASCFNNIEKLILVDSAGIKKKINISVKWKIRKYKFKKWWYKKTKNVMAYNKLILNSGSYDYKVAKEAMKGTLTKVIEEDLRKSLKKIKVETLIIWGKEDKETPYKHALIMNKLIKNSGLVTMENTGHFPYLENKRYFNIVMKEYLKVK